MTQSNSRTSRSALHRPRVLETSPACVRARARFTTLQYKLAEHLKRRWSRGCEAPTLSRAKSVPRRFKHVINGDLCAVSCPVTLFSYDCTYYGLMFDASGMGSGLGWISWQTLSRVCLHVCCGSLGVPSTGSTSSVCSKTGSQLDSHARSSKHLEQSSQADWCFHTFYIVLHFCFCALCVWSIHLGGHPGLRSSSWPVVGLFGELCTCFRVFHIFMPRWSAARQSTVSDQGQNKRFEWMRTDYIFIWSI